MDKIAIVSDTSADMPPELVSKYDIHMVDAFVTFGTEVFVLGDMSLDDFYERMSNSSPDTFPKTSQPRANDLLEVYERLKGTGVKHILSIHVAPSLSGTVNSANVAKGMIDDIDIHIIDSKGVSANLLAVLIKASELVKKGMNVDEIVKKIEEYSNGLTSYLTLKSLDNLVKGGRISKINHFLGRLLNIKPILRLQKSELSAHSKARGFSNAVSKIYSLGTEGLNPSKPYKYIIAHTRESSLAVDLETKLKKNFPKGQGFIIEIGIVVAVHAGSGGLLLMTYN